MKKSYFTCYAISPVIATVIIVAVTIAVAIAFALWASGLLSAAGYGTRPIKLAIHGEFQVRDNDFWIAVKNLGSDPVWIDRVLVNGKPGVIILYARDADTGGYVLTEERQIMIYPGHTVEIYGVTPFLLKPGMFYELTFHTASGIVFSRNLRAEYRTTEAIITFSGEEEINEGTSGGSHVSGSGSVSFGEDLPSSLPEPLSDVSVSAILTEGSSGDDESYFEIDFGEEGVKVTDGTFLTACIYVDPTSDLSDSLMEILIDYQIDSSPETHHFYVIFWSDSDTYPGLPDFMTDLWYASYSGLVRVGEIVRASDIASNDPSTNGWILFMINVSGEFPSISRIYKLFVGTRGNVKVYWCRVGLVSIDTDFSFENYVDALSTRRDVYYLFYGGSLRVYITRPRSGYPGMHLYKLIDPNAYPDGYVVRARVKALNPSCGGGYLILSHLADSGYVVSLGIVPVIGGGIYSNNYGYPGWSWSPDELVSFDEENRLYKVYILELHVFRDPYRIVALVYDENGTLLGMKEYTNLNEYTDIRYFSLQVSAGNESDYFDFIFYELQIARH